MQTGVPSDIVVLGVQGVNRCNCDTYRFRGAFRWVNEEAPGTRYACIKAEGNDHGIQRTDHSPRPAYSGRPEFLTNGARYAPVAGDGDRRPFSSWRANQRDSVIFKPGCLTDSTAAGAGAFSA